jgi:hypothetical protein
MRSIVVLEEAAEDIERGRQLYDLQEMGVGDYFQDTILSDIESLRLFTAFSPYILDSIALSQRDLRLESTTAKRLYSQRFLPFWTSAGIRFGYTRN